MSSRVVGLFVENYIGKECYGHNCDFEYKDEPMIRYHLMIVNERNEKQIIHLERISGECGSGWCCADWITVNVESVKKFPCYNYIPKKVIDIPWNYNNDSGLPDKYRCDVFEYDMDGGDGYYPHGSMSVNLDLFKEIKRSPGKNKRPVWIVSGDSGSGKSFLFNSLNHDISVFETDGYDYLPKQINSSVIIIGNKHGYGLKDIESRLPENSFIVYVNFKKKNSSNVLH